jgi:hypothetical protein
VLKELGDNALDTGAEVRFGYIDGDTFYVEDDGPGYDGTPEEIAELYSIRRPMRSSKLLRLPQRGALGNGLRVVAGAVLASAGSLIVVTNNRRITLRPETDGSTKVVEVLPAQKRTGTRIEIGFGSALPEDDDALSWVRMAVAVARHGKYYDGRSSPFWYDAAQFHELLLACGSQPLRSLVAQLDGCTGSKAGQIVTAAGLDRLRCQDLDRQQATNLLMIARANARPVSPDRLGHVGREAFPHRCYAKENTTVAIGGSEPVADVPFVVEAWARKVVDGKGAISIDVLVNRSPITSEISAWRDDDKDLWIRGGGLAHYSTEAPKKGNYVVTVNVTTPYCPITSDGKAPNLEPFAQAIFGAVAASMRKAQRAAPRDKTATIKDVVLDNLDDAIAAVSGDDEYRFNSRQLLYWLRPIVLEETGRVLTEGNFNGIITDYEDENGEIPGMYREPRGSIYHPHRRETIPLGTLTVEQYERPIWTFNKLSYIEKEGFSEALKDDGWPERNDCSVISSKGFTTRAARDLVDKLAEHDEPITIFCVHDADAYGSVIYQTFQEATKARGARKIKIVNLGLEPWEAIENGLEVEEVPPGQRRKPVANYVLKRDAEFPDEAPSGTSWDDWLQTNRVELNAMTTPEFIAWLDGKIGTHGSGKLIPPGDVITAELQATLEAKMRAIITERILREARFEDQVAAALGAIKQPTTADLTAGIQELFESDPEREWRDHVEMIADDLSSEAEGMS